MAGSKMLVGWIVSVLAVGIIFFASGASSAHQQYGAKDAGHQKPLSDAEALESVKASEVEYVDGPLAPLYDFLIQRRLFKFCKLLRDAALEQTILDLGGSWTLFAPTDASFIFLPGGALEELQRNPQLLRTFILYHFVTGDFPSNQIQNEMLVDSVEGSPLRFNIYGQIITVSGAQILEPDLLFELGRVYIVDRPLYPIPSVDIITYLQSNYKEIYRLLVDLNLLDYISSGTFTLLVPEDDAFDYLSLDLKDAIATNTSLAERIILNHILPGSVYVGGVINGLQWETVGGGVVTFTIKRGLTFVNDIPIVLPDVPLTNGVIHILNRVLLPEGIEAECHCKPSSETNQKPGTRVPGSAQSSFIQNQRPQFGQGQTTQRPGQSFNRPTPRPFGNQSTGTSISGRTRPVSSQDRPLIPGTSAGNSASKPWSPSRTTQTVKPLSPPNQITRPPYVHPGVDPVSDDEINSVVGIGEQPIAGQKVPDQTGTTRYPPPRIQGRPTRRPPPQRVPTQPSRSQQGGPHQSENENYPVEGATSGTTTTDRWSNRVRTQPTRYPQKGAGTTTHRSQTSRTYEWNQQRSTKSTFDQPSQDAGIALTTLKPQEIFQTQRSSAQTSSWQQRNQVTRTTKQPSQKTTFRPSRVTPPPRKQTTIPPFVNPSTTNQVLGNEQSFESNDQQPNCRQQGERINPTNRILPVCIESGPNDCQTSPYNPSDPRPLCLDPVQSPNCRRQGERINPTNRNLPLCIESDLNDCQTVPYNPSDPRPLCSNSVQSPNCRRHDERVNPSNRNLPLCIDSGPNNCQTSPYNPSDPRPLCPDSQSSNCRRQGERINPTNRNLPLCIESDSNDCQISPYNPSDPRPLCPDNVQSDCRNPNSPTDPSDGRPLCQSPGTGQNCREFGQPTYTGDRRPLCPPSTVSQSGCKDPSAPYNPSDRRPICRTTRQPVPTTRRPVPPPRQPVSPSPSRQPVPPPPKQPLPPTFEEAGSPQSCKRLDETEDPQDQRPLCQEEPKEDCRSFLERPKPGDRRPVCKVNRQQTQSPKPHKDSDKDQKKPVKPHQQPDYPQRGQYPTQTTQSHSTARAPQSWQTTRSPQSWQTTRAPQSWQTTKAPQSWQTTRASQSWQASRSPQSWQTTRAPQSWQTTTLRQTVGKQPQRSSFQTKPQTGAHESQPESVSPQTGSYPSRPQSGINPSQPDSELQTSQPQSGAYPSQPLPGTNPPQAQSGRYPTQPQSGRNPSQAHSERYPSQPHDGTQPSHPQSGTYPSQPQSGSHPLQPQTGYPPLSPPSGSYPSDPSSGSNPSHPQSGTYPRQPIPGSPESQPQLGTHSQQPQSGSYPSQPHRDSQPPQLQPGSRPTQPHSGQGQSQPGRTSPSYPQRPGSQTQGVSQPGSSDVRVGQPLTPHRQPGSGQGHQTGTFTASPRRPITTTRVPISVTGTSTTPGEDSRRTLYEIVEDPALLIRGRPVKLTKIFALFHKAGLENILLSPGPNTVFLPSDDAFSALPKGVVDQLEENPELLRQVLSYHVTNSEILPSAQGESFTVPSLEGTQLVITMLNGGRLILISGAKAVAVTRANNGIFYVINQLLYPLPHRDIIGAIQSRPDLSTLAFLLPMSGLIDLLQGQTPYTFLAPTDNAFAQLPQGVYDELTKNTTALQEILLNHVIEGAHYGREFFSGGTFPSARGGKLKFQVVSYGYQVNEVNIKTPEIVTGTGVIHLVDQVLLEDSDLRFFNVFENSVAGQDDSFSNSQQPAIGDQQQGQGPFASVGVRPTSGQSVPGSRQPSLGQPQVGGLQPSVDSLGRIPGQGVSGHQTTSGSPQTAGQVFGGQPQPNVGSSGQQSHGQHIPGRPSVATAFGGRRQSATHGAGQQPATHGTDHQPATQGIGHQPATHGTGRHGQAHVPSHQQGAGDACANCHQPGRPGQQSHGQSGHSFTGGQRVTTHGGTFVSNRQTPTQTAGHTGSGGQQIHGTSQTGGQPNDVADLARSMGLNQFANWISNTGLLEKIHDGGVYTVFAPTDDAVSSLPQDMVQSIESNPEQVKSIMQYHIVPQRVNLNSVTNEETASTLLQGKTIRFNVYQNSQPDCKQLVTASGTPVGEALATMGSIQVIPVTQVLYQPTGDLLKIVEASPILQKLNEAVKSARITWILSGSGPLTFFAPSDTAFDSLTEEQRKTLVEDKQAFSDLLKRHLVRGTFFSSGIQEDVERKSENNKPIKLSLQEGILTVNSVPVTYADITATNGVLHVIDHLL